MENIKNIILDYGNVLFEIDFKRAQQAFSDLGIKDIDQFFAHKAHNSIFDDLETAKSTPAQFRNAIRAVAGNEMLTDTAIDAAWNSLLIGIPDPSIHDVLLELRQKYRLFLLSNNNEIHYEWIINYLQKEFGMQNYDAHFERAYFSQQMKLRKPNVEIFEKVLEENSLNPSETLFIDDSPQHIGGAVKAGLHTLLMTAHPKDIRKFLVEHQIL